MNVVLPERSAPQRTRPAIVDCDIHPYFRTRDDILPFLSAKWREHYKIWGTRHPQPFIAEASYPRMNAVGVRDDSWPPDGTPAGSSLPFMREQLLDKYNIEFGVLQPNKPGATAFNLDLGSALISALNDWQLATWCDPEPRLKASLCVAQDDPDEAIREIERCAGNPAFVQLSLPPRTVEPIGRKRYWRILEAAAYHNLPVAMHLAGHGWYANSGTGHNSYYWEEHVGVAYNMQAIVSSLVMEGVFERIPDLKVVVVEGGFAWAAPLAWRLDQCWERMRSEVPHVKRPPSEYMRRNVWYTTQPIEEPERAGDLLETIRWIGADRLLFSTDYPHWDFDDPDHTFKVKLDDDARRLIMGDNARALFKR